MQFLYPLAAAIAVFASIASAVNPIVVQGSDFVDSVSKDRFQIIGVE